MSRKAVRAYDNCGKWQFTPSLIKKARKHVEYLQTTLFRAFKENWKLRAINRIRLLLKNSYYNKLLSIHKVTHLNTGKKTAGIDKVKIKINNRGQLSQLMDNLTKALNRNKWKPKPNRRIDIPKPDGTTRPLGIPTQFDRIVQMVLNTSLETEVEYLINDNELNSFGFRRKMSTADAVGNLAPYAHIGKWAIIIEADISKCFDKIAHSYVMKLLEGNIIQDHIGRLLKAGHWDDGSQAVITTNEGTPQGGIISPAISNLVLRTVLDKPFMKLKKGIIVQSQTLTTYADDLVISIVPQTRITKDSKKYEEWMDTTSANLMNWLKGQLEIAGLELKPSKTKTITDDTPFTFLGYEIARGKGIKMNPDKVKAFRKKIKDKLKRGRNEKRVVKEINPILRGFYNYAAKFSSGKMWKQLGKIDFDISERCHKLYGKYDIGQVKYTDVPKTTKYISPYKGATWLDDKEYWDKRDMLNLSPRKRTLFRKQKGICPLCKRIMDADEELETHHVKPKAIGGKDKNSNVMRNAT
ncbi:MAG: hypothetical protein BWK78_09550 [Thiotrichaceae bacterium IS1]|nr:MAG: hypothetical protein BWK78_09550 [Thiotrichaceae bacterium IS1]